MVEPSCKDSRAAPPSGAAGTEKLSSLVDADTQRLEESNIVRGDGEFRLGRVNSPRSGNTAADVENASTDTAALTGAKAWSLARTHSAAAAASNSAARPGAV